MSSEVGSVIVVLALVFLDPDMTAFLCLFPDPRNKTSYRPHRLSQLVERARNCPSIRILDLFIVGSWLLPDLSFVFFFAHFLLALNWAFVDQTCFQRPSVCVSPRPVSSGLSYSSAHHNGVLGVAYVSFGHRQLSWLLAWCVSHPPTSILCWSAFHLDN